MFCFLTHIDACEDPFRVLFWAASSPSYKPTNAEFRFGHPEVWRASSRSHPAGKRVVWGRANGSCSDHSLTREAWGKPTTGSWKVANSGTWCLFPRSRPWKLSPFLSLCCQCGASHSMAWCLGSGFMSTNSSPSPHPPRQSPSLGPLPSESILVP